MDENESIVPYVRPLSEKARLFICIATMWPDPSKTANGKSEDIGEFERSRWPRIHRAAVFPPEVQVEMAGYYFRKSRPAMKRRQFKSDSPSSMQKNPNPGVSDTRTAVAVEPGHRLINLSGVIIFPGTTELRT